MLLGTMLCVSVLGTGCGKKEPVVESTEVVEATPPETEPPEPLAQETAPVVENRKLPEAEEDKVGFELSYWKAAKANKQMVAPIYFMEDTLVTLRKATETASESREELNKAFGYDNDRNTNFYSTRTYPESCKTSLMTYLDNTMQSAVDLELLESPKIVFADVTPKGLAALDKTIGEETQQSDFTLLSPEGVINPENVGFITSTVVNYTLYGFNYAFIDDKYDGFMTYVEPTNFKEVTENVDLVKLEYPEDNVNLYIYSNRDGVSGDHVEEYINSLTRDYLKEDLDFTNTEYSEVYNGAKVICPDFTAYLSDAHYEKFLNKLGVKKLYATNNQDLSVLVTDAEAMPDLHAVQSLVDVKFNVTSEDLATIMNTLPQDNIKKTKTIKADKNSVYILTDKDGEILLIGQIDPDYKIPVPVDEEEVKK